MLPYLLFTDDSLLFPETYEETTDNLMLPLHRYEELSRLQVNLQKSSLFFARMTDPNKWSSINSILHNQLADGLHAKYLGLPFLIGHFKTHV